jgi:hypothetical protein
LINGDRTAAFKGDTGTATHDEAATEALATVAASNVTIVPCSDELLGERQEILSP